MSRPTISTVNWYDVRCASASAARTIASPEAASPPATVTVGGGGIGASGYGPGWFATMASQPMSFGGGAAIVGRIVVVGAGVTWAATDGLADGVAGG